MRYFYSTKLKLALPVSLLSFLFFGSLCVVSIMVSTTVKAETVRLVLSHKNLINHDSAVEENSVRNFAKKGSRSKTKYKLKKRCIKTLKRDKNICVPARELVSAEPSIASIQSLNEPATELDSYSAQPFSVVNIESDELDVSSVKETLLQTGWYKAVEEDVKVYTANSSPVSTAALLYNDPDFYAQTYLFSAESELTGSDFISLMNAREANATEQIKVGVAVLDSGFYRIDEVEYTNGYSFVTVDGETPNANFYTEVEGEDPCIAHATGVSSVIGAKTNNNKHMVGAAGNIELHALEVMECGTGYMSDVARALNALAGISGEDYPVYQHNNIIKVANLSLGASGSSGCSVAMQEAINNVNDAGILVVVSAGNTSHNVSTFEPANCDNVLVVTALDENAGKASFANFGSKVDIAAQGVDIFGMNYDGETSYVWEGTSFAAPLVSSAATYMYRENPNLTPEMAKLIIKLTSQEIKGTNCSNGRCGSGLVNAKAMAELSGALNSVETNKITYMLADKTTCDQQWYLDNFGDSVDFCSMLKLTFTAGLTGGQFYELYEAPKNNPSDETLIKEGFQSSTLFLPKSDFDVLNNYYLVKLCDESSCDISLPLDTSDIANGSPICP